MPEPTETPEEAFRAAFPPGPANTTPANMADMHSRMDPAKLQAVATHIATGAPSPSPGHRTTFESVPMTQLTNGPSGFLEAPATTEERGVVVDWQARAEKAEARVEEMRAGITEYLAWDHQRDMEGGLRILRASQRPGQGGDHA